MSIVINYDEYIRNVMLEYGKANYKLEKVPNIVNICETWYKGFDKTFHEYYIPTGYDSVKKCAGYSKQKKLPMYMGKKLCEDFANLLINEKCDIVIEQKKEMDLILANTKSWTKLNKGIEISFALGYGCIVQGVNNLGVDETGHIVNKDEAEITNTFVPATQIRPLVFNEGKLEDVAFIFENSNSANIIMHIKDTRKVITNENKESIKNANYNNYDIVNIMIDLSSKNRQETKYTFHTLTSHPFFQLLQPNIINNFDIDSPLGLSILANSIDTLKAVDNAYDSLNNEIQLGRKRIVADVDTFTAVDDKGNVIETFSPNDILFYKIPARDGKIGEENKQLLEDVSGQLRIDQICNALNQQLNVLSSKVGMGENYYNYEVGKRISTATQVISENGQLFRTLKKHEILIEQALKDMVISLAYINNNFTNNVKFNNIDYNDITIQFDDSIIEDTEAQKTSDRADVTAGVMSKVEYRMKYYGEDEKTALDNLLKFNVDVISAKSEQLQEMLNNGLISVELYVDLVFKGVEDVIPTFNREELINKIKENIENNKPVVTSYDGMDDLLNG